MMMMEDNELIDDMPGGMGEGGPKKEENDVTDSFGTLQLGEGSSQSRFFGIAAGAHYLLGVSVVRS